MLNKWIGMGRLTAAPELKTTPSGTSVATFTVAVERDFKGQNGEKQTDFLNVVAWGKTGEFASRFFDKGNMICVEGSVQTRTYNAQDGTKRYVTEIIASNVYFTGEKKEAATTPYAQPTAPQDAKDYVQLEDDEDLPF